MFAAQNELVRDELDAQLKGLGDSSSSRDLPPIDRRIQNFLNDYLKDANLKSIPQLPAGAFNLSKKGWARTWSLPPDKDHFSSDIVNSYRVRQGVLHNPKHDRRTTQGVFHVAEGGLPIPDDKLAVPKHVYGRLLAEALNPPESLTLLPYTATAVKPVHVILSLLMRPLVCPAAGELVSEKSMEIRFFAPGNLVGNLDFVEGIFGNGGDPYAPENDAALDPEHWTGHSGCVILAPHLIYLRKKDLGLPSWDKATERQRRDGMCWKKEDELYNGGAAFKVTARDERGVMVTVIADNYFGYCKKEVKTQISFSANLFGFSEEEHAGGAIAFARYILGQEFQVEGSLLTMDKSFQDVVDLLGDRIEVKTDGYAVDKKYPDIFYVPENTTFNVSSQKVSWIKDGQEKSIKILAGHAYILPSGYKIHMEKQPGTTSWRLVGTVQEGTLCHKPCTVSGGGKSEISKSIAYSMIQGPVFVREFSKDLDEVADLIKKDYSNCYREVSAKNKKKASRPILSPARSLGSVIKLFTPSEEYTDDYNAWLKALPNTLRQLVFVIKRYYRPEWGENWRQHFSVDRINGFLGHELKYDGRPLVSNYLRVGLDREKAWRIFKLRSDFHPAEKVQVEDDISVSVVVPRDALKGLNPDYKNPSLKIVANCESLLFQRPDDAVIRGYDKQAEADIASEGTFLSNFEPISRESAKELTENIVDFDLYTEPMRVLLAGHVSDEKSGFVVSSAHPRLVDGKPSKNPRYLQKRPDLVNHRDTYLAQMGTRVARSVNLKRPVYWPVNAVLAGRRNNPPDPKADVPALAVYNPIHYQELPELFLDFVCSLTGKSPSTTGFGSEGALTKGPFNALWPVVDLNNTMVSYILTGYAGFTSAAGHVGPNIRVEHDISLLIPEIWCRMTVAEREPAYLIKNGYLERVENYEHEGREIHARILGYRITSRFVDAFLGRLFETPNMVFTEEMLKPELQDPDVFADGIENIMATYKRVAAHYFEDGSVNAAVPPLKALLHIMKDGTYEGKDIGHPDIRKLFTREAMIESDWYKERLAVKQSRDVAFWEKQIQALKTYSGSVDVKERLARAQDMLAKVQSPAYLQKIHGTIGADPFKGQISDKTKGSHAASRR